MDAVLHERTHARSEDPGWAHKHDVMMMITTHNRPGVFHSTYQGMQGNCWQIMTVPLRWHDNQVLLHLVMAAQYQSLHVGWQHYNHYYHLQSWADMLSCHADVLQITSRPGFRFILDRVPSAISLRSQLTREEIKMERQGDFLRSPCQMGFCLISEDCQVYPTSFCSRSRSAVDALGHCICGDITFDLICQLLHWALWYPPPSPLEGRIRLINQAGLFCVPASAREEGREFDFRGVRVKKNDGASAGVDGCEGPRRRAG